MSKLLRSRKELSRMKSSTNPLALALALTLVLAAPGCKKGGDAEPEGSRPYAVKVEAPSPGKTGEPLTARVRLEPRDGYKVNLEYPAKLEVMGPMGAAPMRQTINSGQAASLTEQELVMDASFTLGRGGEHRFSGKLNFSVCTETVCEVKSEDVSWTASISE